MRAGLPSEPAEVAALAAALAIVAVAPRLFRMPRRAFVTLAAALAAVLSALYVAVYLRGGPRIIDATAYFLEARMLAHGKLSFALGEPAASTIGRFMVRPGGDGAEAAVIFPPGYPAALALGFVAGAPMAVGPILAALVTLVTWSLARRLGGDADEGGARIAALLSVVCAALRYHTADTMSHGLAALCFAGSLACGFAAADADAASDRRGAGLAGLGAGLFAGWLAATRPVSALALAGVAVVALASAPRSRRSSRLRLSAIAAAGALPGLTLLALHQHAATGTWFASSQRLYYALADGPPGCFSYGFGARIGCVGEHGDFVQAHLAHGYGALEALGTTLRRLRLHLVDGANAEPLFLLVVAAGVATRRAPRARLVVVAVALQMVAYAPFYFDGNYPGGGARLFADVLPLEHAIVGVAAARWGPRSVRREAPSARTLNRWAIAPVALALLGFAFRAGFEHAALRDREGGRPMYSAEELARAGASSSAGLVFVNTDHAMNLGLDVTGAGADVVRQRGDDLDLLVWRGRGRPAAFVYDFDVATGAARIAPRAFDDAPASLRIEGESLWPAVAQEGGFVLVEHASGTCASAGRWLRLHSAGGEARVALELPAALAGHDIAPHIAIRGDEHITLELEANGATVGRWAPPGGDSSENVWCIALAAVRLPAESASIRLLIRGEIHETAGLFALDRLSSTAAKSVDPAADRVRDSQ